MIFLVAAGCASAFSPGVTNPPTARLRASAGLRAGLAAVSSGLADVVAVASPSIVKINNETRLIRSSKGYFEGLFAAFFGLFRIDPYYEYPYRVISLPLYLLFGAIELRDLNGSGFALGEGKVVTNAHVVENASKIVCELIDGRRVAAKLLEADVALDLAVLELEGAYGPPPPPLAAREAPVRPGEPCLAIGFPGRDTFASSPITQVGESGPPNPTVTLGIVSAVDVDLGNDRTKYVETDAALNPGNSGGPVLDVDGKVIGIATMIGAGKQGEGYVVPVGTILRRFPELAPVASAATARGAR